MNIYLLISWPISRALFITRSCIRAFIILLRFSVSVSVPCPCGTCSWSWFPDRVKRFWLSGREMFCIIFFRWVFIKFQSIGRTLQTQSRLHLLTFSFTTIFWVVFVIRSSSSFLARTANFHVMTTPVINCSIEFGVKGVTITCDSFVVFSSYSGCGKSIWFPIMSTLRMVPL